MRTVLGFLVALSVAACSGDPVAGKDGRDGLTGPAGPVGPMGAMGTMGERGPAGTGAAGSGPTAAAYRPLFWVGCGKALDLLTSMGGMVVVGKDGATETLLDYTVTAYSTRDLDVSCSAQAGSAQDGSSAHFYPAAVNGAASGHCGASVDLPPFPPSPGNVGSWQFEVIKGGPVATYVDADPGHPLNGFRYTFVEADCTALLLGADLKWSTVKLADVF